MKNDLGLTVKRLALALVLFSLAAPALAKDCILDKCADKNPPPPASPSAQEPVPQRAPAGRPSALAPGDFDFYVLALSWSPGFCEQSSSNSRQCEPGQKLGFVVHGLWPQYEHGFPSECGGGGTTVSRLALERAKGLYPDEGLARHEWRTHGACTGRSPGDYFDDVARARNSVTIPDLFKAPSADQTLSTQEIEQDFRDANPRLRPGMMGVECKGETLSEVRICVTKDLAAFRPCPEIARRSCRLRSLHIPAPY